MLLGGSEVQVVVVLVRMAESGIVVLVVEVEIVELQSVEAAEVKQFEEEKKLEAE